MENKIIWQKFQFPDETEDHDEDEYDDDNDDGTSILTQIISSNQNPFAQLKTYNFWTIHTNFKLTAWLIMSACEVLGVESVDIVSPYRAYLSIGLAFEESDVKQRVQKKLLEIVNDSEKSERDTGV